MSNRKLVFDCHSSSTINIDEAAKLDAVVKGIGFEANFTLKSEAESESRKKFIYNLEF